jgi:hypothetical protein
LFLPLASSITKVLNRQTSQEVCPHNNPKLVQITSEEAFWPRAGVHGERLIELMEMDQAEFSRRFKNSPVKRTKRRGLLRNVAVALGNWWSPEAVSVLESALNDEEPLIRGHAAWALGRVRLAGRWRLCSAASNSREKDGSRGDRPSKWIRLVRIAGSCS